MKLNGFIGLFCGVLVTLLVDVEAEMSIYGDRGINVLNHINTRSQRQDTFDPMTERMLDDMIIDDSTHEKLFSPETRRNAVVDRAYLWPNRTVPYYIGPEFQGEHRASVKEGIDMIESQTCVRFVEIFNPDSFPGPHVLVRSIEGCYARVGAKCMNNACEVSLQIPHCLKTGIIAHEFLHVLGFFHMQCAAGRSAYIDVKWENVYDQMYSNFEEYNDLSTLLDTPYDYDSITHYGKFFFSKNGQSTITTKDKMFQNTIGQRDHLSLGDILRVQRLYECEENY